MRRLDLHMRDNETLDTVVRAVRAAEPVDYYITRPEQKDRALVSVFLRDGSSQSLMDNLQAALEEETEWRISLIAIEATVPDLPKPKESDQEGETQRKQALREEIYADVNQGATLDRDFMILVGLSTVVAAVGLNSDSVAAVIGAMVIAPLLGPILGFGLGAALGDKQLLFGSGKTLGVGVVIALVCSTVLSFMVDVNLDSRELVSRAEVRLDGIALAIAAGSAAAMSMARGQAAVLVGVMVAAALLPPGAAIGLFIGAAEWELASRSALLLALNVACLIFAALVVFRIRNIRPRGWIDRKNADRAVYVNLFVSFGFLVICVVLIAMLDLGARISIG